MSAIETQPRRKYRLLLLIVLGVFVAFALFILLGNTRSVGIHPVSMCPKNELTPTEVQTLYESGLARADQGKIGEYRLMSSIYEALPLLKRAALHGHRGAIGAYGGFFIRQGAIEMRRFDGLFYPDATAEGMMWSILAVHLGREVVPQDESTYAILLNPQTPFPNNFFDHPSGSAWMFQMLTESGLDWARQQAFAWRHCWANEVL